MTRLFFYTTGSLPIPLETREWFLNVWLKEQGHSFLGVHCAADTYHDYEPYWDMIGGTFNGHPWAANSRVVIKVHDGTHPASKPWGATDSRIPWQDEIYQFKNWQPEKVRVLMSLDMQQTELKKPYHVPVLWVKPYGAGACHAYEPRSSGRCLDEPDLPRIFARWPSLVARHRARRCYAQS